MALKSVSELQADLVTALATASAGIRDTRPISAAGALVNAVASAVADGHLSLADMRSTFYVAQCRRSNLDRRISDVGMIRNQGSLSTGSVVAFLATGAPGQSIPAGTLLQSAGGVQFVTTGSSAASVSSPYAIIPVSAVSVGYNDLAAGTVLTNPNGSFSLVTFKVGSAVNGSNEPTGHLSGGTPKETDEQVIARYPAWIKGLAKTTYDAVKAVLAQTSGVSNLVVENATPTAGWITISIAATGAIPLATRNAVDAALLANGPCSMGYVLKALQTRNTPVVVTVYTDDLSLSPGTVKQKVGDAISGLTASPLAGQSIYLDAIRVAITNAGAGVKTTVFAAPLTDVIAAPSDIVVLTPVTVNVEYLN